MSISNLPGIIPGGTGPDEPLATTDPMQDVLENKNLIFQLALIGGILKIAKMPGGMKAIQTIGKEFMHGVWDSADSLAQSASANPISAWACPMLLSGLYERFGILPPAFNRGFHDGISKISGMDTVTGILETLLAKDSSFPETLNFAKGRGSGDTETITTMAKMIPALAGVPV